jgi:hypothetical protein
MPTLDNFIQSISQQQQNINDECNVKKAEKEFFPHFTTCLPSLKTNK